MPTAATTPTPKAPPTIRPATKGARPPSISCISAWDSSIIPFIVRSLRGKEYGWCDGACGLLRGERGGAGGDADRQAGREGVPGPQQERDHAAVDGAGVVGG